MGDGQIKADERLSSVLLRTKADAILISGNGGGARFTVCIIFANPPRHGSFQAHHCYNRRGEIRLC